MVQLVTIRVSVQYFGAPSLYTVGGKNRKLLAPRFQITNLEVQSQDGTTGATNSGIGSPNKLKQQMPARDMGSTDS